MVRPPSRQRARSGCLPMGLTCLATCVLLALNAVLISAVMEYILAIFPEWMQRPKFQQALLFVLPMLMTIAQWWVVDWIFFQARDRSSEIQGTGDPAE